MIGAIGVRRHEEGGEDDPFWIVAGAVLDAVVVPGPLSKSRREDLQVWSFLAAVARTSGGQHPINVSEGSDPPDRIVGSGDQQWGLELTELTLQDVRGALARVRQFGRSLEQRLRHDQDRFGHLRGRVIALSALEPDTFGAEESALDEVLEALSDDIGCVGDAVDFTDGLPEQVPPDGFYGSHGGAHLQAYRGQPADGLPSVSSTAQSRFHKTELVELLQRRINAKDKPENHLLLISCALPDGRGYQCPADGFLFASLLELARAGELELTTPRHLRGIAVHHWPHEEWFELYCDGSSVPWRST